LVRIQNSIVDDIDRKIANHHEYNDCYW
jgi:hypothetical protein